MSVPGGMRKPATTSPRTGSTLWYLSRTSSLYGVNGTHGSDSASMWLVTTFLCIVGMELSSERGGCLRSVAAEHVGELAGLGLLDPWGDAVQQPARSDVLGGHRLDQLALANGVDDRGRHVLGRHPLRAVVVDRPLLAGRQAAAHDRRGADRRVDDPRAQRGHVDAARCELG